MCHAANRHFPTHHIHRRFTYKTAAQYQSMCTRAFKTLGHLHRLIYLHAAPETVTHVHLHKHCHIAAGSLHHFIHHHIHKAHAVFQRTAKFIFTMIGRRRKELADKVAMSGMNFHCIKSRLTGQIHRLSVSTCHLRQFTGTQTTHKSR